MATAYKWVIVSVCVLCGMLYVSDFVKGMPCNICNLRMDIRRKLATDSMNVVMCIGLLYSLLSTRPEPLLISPWNFSFQLVAENAENV